jgi:hypothetical protein
LNFVRCVMLIVATVELEVLSWGDTVEVIKPPISIQREPFLNGVKFNKINVLIYTPLRQTSEA